jgi:hypothetical protein
MAADDRPTPSTEERLERGELIFFPECPFPLPTGDDRAFLLAQRLSRFSHKNISYDPATNRLNGHVRRGRTQTDRLRDVLAGHSRSIASWLHRTLPHYSVGITLDRATFRSEEEATRCLRHTARNDLLHVDSFPNRPAFGRRILRVFANVNPAEPRVWMTSDPFAKLFAKYGERAGLPGRNSGSWLEQVGQSVIRIFRPGRSRRSDYDAFMLRFHDFLKLEDAFQEKCSKRIWSFPAGSAWLAMTDACSHAVLRGRFALEHSFFIGGEVLALPGESPVSLLSTANNSSASEAA